MTDRDRLIDLLSYFADGYNAENRHIVFDTKVCDVADYLLANGVIVPPCKVGDYAKYKYNEAETIWKIISISFYAEGEPQISLTYGKTTNSLSLPFFQDWFVIIPKEEAEKALKK